MLAEPADAGSARLQAATRSSRSRVSTPYPAASTLTTGGIHADARTSSDSRIDVSDDSVSVPETRLSTRPSSDTVWLEWTRHSAHPDRVYDVVARTYERLQPTAPEPEPTGPREGHPDG